MEKILSVARLFNELFKAEYNTDMDEMRMHKMMYFAQRESLMYNKKPLFDGEFKGWKYGPVLAEVRSEYKTGDMFQSVSDKLSEDAEKLVTSVYQRYKELSSWQLSSLSHGELSWKCSREGLNPDDDGNVKLKLSDMRVDAARELLKRKKTERTK